MRTFSGARILVVGGAGFVGSNLVRSLLAHDLREVLVVDNLLSAERENVPADDRVRLIEASINDDDVLAASPTTSTSSFTCRPTTATRARWPTRWPTTSTTR